MEGKKRGSSLVSWSLDRHKRSIGNDLGSVVTHMLDFMRSLNDPRYKISSKQDKYAASVEDHIRVVLINLVSAYNVDPDIWIEFMEDNNAYQYKRGTKGFKVKVYQLRKVTKFMKEFGFITSKPGHPESAEWAAQPAKMKMKSKLVDLIQSHLPDDQDDGLIKPIPLEVIKDHTNITTIHMKGKRYRKKVRKRNGSFRWKWVRDDVKILQRDFHKVKRLGTNVKKINAVLAKAEIDLDITRDEFREMNWLLNRDPDKSPVDLTSKFLSRTFHDQRLDRHGRFYGAWYQGIPEEYRDKILIDGMPTIERDFKSLHPSMLYCLVERPIPTEDLYTLPGYDHNRQNPKEDHYRKLFKQVMLTMINAENNEKAFGAVCNKWAKKKAKAKRQEKSFQGPPIRLKKKNLLPVMEKIREKHNPIQKYFDDPAIGNLLMNYDSQIMEKVLLHFAKKGVATLPVHDSLIVPIEHSTECWQVMEAEFEKMFHQKIEVTGIFSDAFDAAMERPRVKERCSRWDELEDMSLERGSIMDDEEYQKHWK